MMIEFLGLLALLIADEPNRAIDDGGIQLFIESQRTANSGPGKILATASGSYDDDAYADKLVIYTYQQGSAQGDEWHGLFAVAFLTKNFETTDVLFIPEAEIIPDSLRQYSSDGTELVIRAKKRLPGDAMCCPSAIVSIVLSVKDGKVVILKGEYRNIRITIERPLGADCSRAASCGGQKSEVVTATIDTGEKIRVVSIDAQPPHPSQPALCVEILPWDGALAKPGYESFAEFANSRNLFEGWSAVQIRAYPGVEFQTLADAIDAAFVVGERDVRQYAPPCPD